MPRLRLLFLAVLPLLALPGCAFQGRADRPGWITRVRAARMEMSDQQDDIADDPCHYRLQLENAILKEQLKNCTPAAPAATAPVKVQIKPVEIELVPKVGAMDFPAPAESELTAACCPPPPR
ncbi:MAG TPA: hypothetical protein VM537_06670 [Anaerolineae bacterium]|nr:hypothetical protein [Anaerolineae bacterium]